MIEHVNKKNYKSRTSYSLDECNVTENKINDVCQH